MIYFFLVRMEEGGAGWCGVTFHESHLHMQKMLTVMCSASAHGLN